MNTPAEHDELAGILRHHDGLRHSFRLANLRSTLARGPAAVAHTTQSVLFDRLGLWLDDGRVLELRTYSQRRIVVAALVDVMWDDRIGWVVVVRASDGSIHVVYAWRARLVDPVR